MYGIVLYTKKSFPKIRVNNKTKKTVIDTLMDETKKLKKNLNKNKEKIVEVEEKNSTLKAENNRKIIKDHVNFISDTEGGFNIPNMWKLKKKIFPKTRDPLQLKKIN